MVVGKFEEDPGAVLHLSGVNLVDVPVIRQVVQIIGALQHLAAEVRTLIDTNLIRTKSLQDRDGGFG